ncbi:MAG: hypothetical protein RI885_1008 [Actinomycetota bacterium]
MHEHGLRRRRRDNVLAVAGVLVVATLATVTQVLYFTAGPGLPEAVPSASPSADAGTGEDAEAAEQNVGDVPSAEIAEGRSWTGTLTLNDVPLGLSIDGAAAPQAASVFISLAQSDFYLGNVCHRLTAAESSSVIQCGQPDGTVTIDPGFSFGPIENAPADGLYPAGTIAVARSDSPFSQSTQFFITYRDSVLDTSTGGYSVIGTVTSGLDAFASGIAAAGIAPGGQDPTDGAPAVTTTITGLTVQ